MATLSLLSLGGSPGTYVNERTSPTSGSALSSFNTVYMLVEAPEEVSKSSSVFPPNTPVPVYSVSDYLNYIGGSVPASGDALMSYLNVETFFKGAAGGDLRVVRIGTPGNVVKLSINPAGSKDNGSNPPSLIEAGDTFFVQLKIDNVSLGQKTSSGILRGIEVTSPVSFDGSGLTGSVENNLLISTAIRDAIVSSIESNSNVNSSVYVRSVGIDSGTGMAYLTISSRTFGKITSVINLTEPAAGTYALSASSFIVSPVSISESLEERKQDYLQTINTAFQDPELPQGYLIAPTAFSKFKKEDRATIGAAMESVASSDSRKWMALVDPGSFYVTDIEDYRDLSEHKANEGFRSGEQYLVDNAVYEWTDSDYIFASANYGTDAAESANSDVIPGYANRLSLVDDKKVTIIGSNTSSNVLTLSRSVPTTSSFTSGTQVRISGSTINGVPDGLYYAILQDTDPTLSANQLKIASSVGNALSDNPIDVLGSGSGSLEYDQASWVKSATIDGKTSGLIESVRSSGASFNTSYLPGSLQDPTEEIAFKQINRAVSDPSLYATRGNFNKITAADVNTGTGVITATSHGLQTGNKVYFDLVGTGALTTGTLVGGSVTGLGTVTATGTYTNGTYTAVATTVAPAGGTGATLNFTVSGGSVTSVTVSAPGSAYTTSSVLTVASGSHGDAFSVQVISVSSALSAGSIEVGNGIYYAIRTGVNTLKLAKTYEESIVGVNAPLAGPANDPTFGFLGVLARNPDLTIHIKNHGFTNGASVMVDRNILSPSGPVVVGATTSSVTHRYYAKKIDNDCFSLATSLSSLGSNLLVSCPEVGIVSNSTTPGTLFYGDLLASTSSSIQFRKVPELRVIRGRKYRVNVGLIDKPLLNVNGVAVPNYKTALRFASAPDTTGYDNYFYKYFIDSNGEQISKVSPFVADGNYFCVPLEVDDNQSTIYSTGSVYESDGTVSETTVFGSPVQVNFAPFQEVPKQLWNFKTVSAGDIIDEALRGSNSLSGSPQAVLVDHGIDTHSRLFEESQMYRSSRGFIAFYGPYIKNESGYWVSPTPYVAGVALRRYRAEGFQFPPAGSKYQLAGATDCQIKISSSEQDVSNPYGLNALRQLSGYPKNSVFIWGSRTRANPDIPEEGLYKFVNTRVILNVIYGSLSKSFDSDIFSVVDGKDLLFSKIRASAQNTLYNLYQAGALFGNRPEDAYQVICDRKNNPAGLLEQGIVNLSVFVVPSPTMERIQVDLIRVEIDGIKSSLDAAGFGGTVTLV